jgi:hypothetical protein
MCRIASLFLLQRLKESTQGEARFLQNQNASCHQVFLLQGKALKKIHASLIETSGEQAPSHATVKNWVSQFKFDDFFTYDLARPERLKTMITPEIIDQILELILGDRKPGFG